MAALADADRFAAWAELMRLESDDRQVMALSKADLRAALNAADAWVDTNAGSFNTALPLPARTALTARQKARLLAVVLSSRYRLGL